MAKLHFETSADIESVFEQFRSNLLADGYSRTTIEVQHADCTDPNRIRCLVTYANFDRNGLMMNSEDVACFLEGRGHKEWKLTMVEYVNDPLEPLFSGIEGVLAPNG